jgi:hypothetical protein
MSAPEMVLDYIQVLIWPALIAVGVFWLFRSQARRLFDNAAALFDRSRVTEVEIRGVKFTLEQAAEALQANVEERREEVAKAEDPQERERAVEKLERDAAALRGIELFEAVRSSPQDTESGAIEQEYLGRVRQEAKARLSWVEARKLDDRLTWRFASDRYWRGNNARTVIARLGTPEQVVDAWLRGENVLTMDKAREARP